MSKDSRCLLIDADVIIHFIKASEITAIHSIFPNKIYILDKVYEELDKHPGKKQQVANLLNLKILTEMKFPEDNAEIRREYAYIKKVLFKGTGESACLAVARFSGNILASSNLKDISEYCITHGIDYLTTMDFLCEALSTNKWTEERCDAFITAVLAGGSRLPVSKMRDYTCRVLSFMV